jgi:hypothetical protein
MKYLLLLTVFFGQMAFAANIDIDADADNCVNGHYSMDVDVTVDGEHFSFSPSCVFSYDDSIVTSTGLQCVVAAGMCSALSPKGRFEVSCSDTSDESIGIRCP